MTEQIFTFLMGAAATVFSGILLFFLQALITRRPKLRWSILDCVDYPHDKGIFVLLDDILFEYSRAANDEIEKDGRKRVRDLITPSRLSVTVSIDNLGNRSAENVKLLLSEPPVFVSAEPSIGLHQKATADGKVLLEIDSIPLRSQVILKIFGVRITHVEDCTHNGDRVARRQGRNLLRRDDLNPIRVPSFLESAFWLMVLAVAGLNLLFFFSPWGAAGGNRSPEAEVMREP